MKQLISTTTWFLILLGMAGLFGGCCELGVTCYELLVFGEPPLNNATIYLDGKVVKSQAVQFTYLKVPYEKHEIRVEQNGFRPFVTILEGGPGRSERRLLVKFESLDSVPATPSQSDIAKTVE